MKQTQDSIREQISAFADGSLQGRDLSDALDAIASDDTARSTWGTYHLIGDVLRTGEHAPCSDASAFVARLQKRLAAEVPRPVPVSVATQPAAARRIKVKPVAAANEPVFRWKLVAGAASLAAAAAIGWNLVGFGSPAASGGGMQLAQQQSQSQSTPRAQQANAEVNPVLVASQGGSAAAANDRLEAAARVQGGNGEPQVMLRDARLDLLLEAHRQAGGASQMPSGFLRNATFDGPAR